MVPCITAVLLLKSVRQNPFYPSFSPLAASPAIAVYVSLHFLQRCEWFVFYAHALAVSRP